MKVKPEHLAALKVKIDTFIGECGGWDTIVYDYENGLFARADKVKDLQKRFCFDVMNYAGTYDEVQRVYEYANDDHLFTALKAICPTVNRKY